MGNCHSPQISNPEIAIEDPPLTEEHQSCLSKYAYFFASPPLIVLSITSKVPQNSANIPFSQESSPSKLLAWCSKGSNRIKIVDFKTSQEHARFEGVQLKRNPQYEYRKTTVKGILNTNLLISLSSESKSTANMEIFDLSHRGKPRKICSFEEDSNLRGWGDAAINSKRNIVGALSRVGEISYHIFSAHHDQRNTYGIKLLRASKWHPHHLTAGKNRLTDVDFDPSGKLVATIDCNATCVISELDTDDCKFCYKLCVNGEWDGNCFSKWSTNIGEPLVFTKFNKSLLNVLDVEKQALTLKDASTIEAQWNETFWIDVCPNDGNLVAMGGETRVIRVYDRRVSRVVRTIDDIHSDFISCVRWDPSGNLLATASWDSRVKLIDFKSGRVIQTGNTVDGSKLDKLLFPSYFRSILDRANSVCFL